MPGLCLIVGSAWVASTNFSGINFHVLQGSIIVVAVPGKWRATDTIQDELTNSYPLAADFGGQEHQERGDNKEL